MTATEIAIVGVGKIARRTSTFPRSRPNSAFSLGRERVSASGGLDGIENHATLEAVLAPGPMSAPSRYACPRKIPFMRAARAALLAGRHVLLEKPPGRRWPRSRR